MTPDDRFDDAFRRLFEEQFPSLFRYMNGLSGDPALAADLAQEAFTRLYRRRSLPLDARAWLVSVAGNLLRDERRGVERRRRLLVAVLPTAGFQTRHPAPEDEVLAAERRAMVRRALGALTERDRQVLLLRHEGYSYREIAKALDLEESSIGTFVARAKRAFQTAFQEIYGASE
jgi:RNA polymerase sigma factor (sigma-70 family)